MSRDDRHINFKLMRDWILDHQDAIDSQNDGRRSPGDKNYWRSLEELADSPQFHEFVQREFPQQAEEWDDPIERRTFLKLMGASLALAGLSGCVYQPPEKIVPYVRQPEESVPGRALFYATAASLGGIATPLLVRSNEGRPTKVEGNPDHPNNLNANVQERGSSATDLFSQASIIGLYDPDRSKNITYREEIRTWTTFLGEMRTALDVQRGKQGAGIRFLTETVTSPTLGAQLKGILTEFPQAKWHQYEPVNRDNARAGAMMALGQPVNTTYDFSKAERILALDSDFLSARPGYLRYARDYAARRRVTGDRHEMNRLYVIETTASITGANADHRWAVRPSELEEIARSLLMNLPEAGLKSGLVQPVLGQRGPLATSPPDVEGIYKSPEWINAVLKDLQQYRGASIVIAGNEAPPFVHAAAHSMNDALGNVGNTVFYTDPLEFNSVDQRQSLQELVNDIDGGRVELLIILGGNPVYNTPVDLKLDKDRLLKFQSMVRVHLSSHKDETSELCHWHIPEAHYLESWSDTRSYDGTVTITQPLIEPLYGGKSAHELLAVFTQQYDRNGYDIVRDYWGSAREAGVRSLESGVGSQQTRAGSRQEAGGSQQQAGAGGSQQQAMPSPSPSAEFEAWWRKALHDGFVRNTALPTRPVGLNSNWATQLQNQQPSYTLPPPSGAIFEVVFRTDPSIYDGRFANNGWLQELPKPLTKITWDNAALVSPYTANRLGLHNTVGWRGGEIRVDNIRIDHRGQSITCPTWIMPGQPDDVITVHLGYGRRRAGQTGNEKGFNAYQIRTSDTPWAAFGVSAGKTAGLYHLAVTQLHFNMEGRDVLRTGTLDEYNRGDHGGGHDAHAKTHVPKPDETLYGNEHKYEGYAWGMAIDANSCIGCNACVVACQAENNVPIVGREQVIRSREMHWLRVDTYFEGPDAGNPRGTYFMPVPCMHCENAPCEPVCPVHATVHSAEGLNDMVYNRCVGTRYCSNNCPYKVRRFNFHLYQDWNTETYQLMRNPEVSVRSRGVMEKCTYCVQRIQEAKINAELENRPVRDGEIVTACQAVCPTETIVFGNINDPNSKVAKLKAEKRNYSLLADLNTRPRTTYLEALRNPNPEIGGVRQESTDH
ncbi:MAG TPA: TAT-variant-translocated molybdopterin oxidoreductase [Pyrinomonadaceae bacterium]|nr:TAT-variant-translocated molybdopterin oxidoreductase [Pyrinomonadaceae bacterium]